MNETAWIAECREELVGFLEKALEDAINDDFTISYTEMVEYRIAVDDYEERPQGHSILVDREDIEMIVKALKEVK